MVVDIVRRPPERKVVDKIGESALKVLVESTEYGVLDVTDKQVLLAVEMCRESLSGCPATHSTFALIVSSGSLEIDGAGRVHPWLTSLSLLSNFRLVSNCTFSAMSFSSVQSPVFVVATSSDRFVSFRNASRVLL